MLTHLKNEAALVTQAQTGDEDAFATLYNQYSRHVFRLALKITHDLPEAEDVLQDTFLKVFVHLREFRKESRFSTWLTRIAANEALTRLRRRGQKRISLDAPIEVHGERLPPRETQDQQDDAEEAYRRLELRTMLSNVIEKLTPSSRMVLALRYEQDVSTEATARLLGLSISAVKTRLLRARLAAREALRESVGRDSRVATKVKRRLEPVESPRRRCRS